MVILGRVQFLMSEVPLYREVGDEVAVEVELLDAAGVQHGIVWVITSR